MKPHLQGAEIELAIVDRHDKPVFEIDGQQPLHHLQKVFADDSRMKDLRRIGSMEEEVFRHQIEIVTHVQRHQDLIAKTLELYDLTIDMLMDLGLRASNSQPIPVDMYNLEAVITPGPYYLPSMSQVDRHFPARNASTTALHVHHSFGDNLITLQAHAQLCRVLSQEMTQNQDWYLKHQMSHERYKSRSQIVSIRNAIGETIGPMDQPIVGDEMWDEFILGRYFPGKSIEDVLKMDCDIPRDHRGQALKKKGQSFTTESRLADGPGMDRKYLEHSLLGINDFVESSLDDVQFLRNLG